MPETALENVFASISESVSGGGKCVGDVRHMVWRKSGHIKAEVGSLKPALFDEEQRRFDNSSLFMKIHKRFRWPESRAGTVFHFHENDAAFWISKNQIDLSQPALVIPMDQSKTFCLKKM